MSWSTRIVAIPTALIWTIVSILILFVGGCIALPNAYIKAGNYGIVSVMEALSEVNSILMTGAYLIAQGKMKEAVKYMDDNIPS